jgi:hypothetical protein
VVPHRRRPGSVLVVIVPGAADLPDWAVTELDSTRPEGEPSSATRRAPAGRGWRRKLRSSGLLARRPGYRSAA